MLVELSDDVFGNGPADVVLGDLHCSDAVEAGVEGEAPGYVVHHPGLARELKERVPGAEKSPAPAAVTGGVVVTILGTLRDAEHVHDGVHVRHRQPLGHLAVRTVCQRSGSDRCRVHGLPQVQDARPSRTAVLLEQFTQPLLADGAEVDDPMDCTAHMEQDAVEHACRSSRQP